MPSADRLRSKGEENERDSCNTRLISAQNGFQSQPLQSHFVFPVRTPALITYRPNRQINELKATPFEKGRGRGKGRGGEQLPRCADSGSGFQAGCDQWSSCLHLWPVVVTEEASGEASPKTWQNKSIQAIKGNLGVLSILLNLNMKKIDTHLEWRKQLRCHWDG